MSGQTNTLVVLIDAEDVKYAFSTWPDEICLAACLDRDGLCRFVVFRREERTGFPGRLLRLLNRSREDVSFVPRVPGFPTRQFRYSDERRLMTLIASDPAILEEAIDYAVNVTYAIEEGLDPSVLLGRVSDPKASGLHSFASADEAIEAQQGNDLAKGATPPNDRARELSPLLPEFLRRSAEMSRRPRFSSVRRAKIAMVAPQP